MSGRENGAEAGPAEGAVPSERPKPIYNWLSMVSCALGACSLTAIAFLVLVGLLTRDASGYSGVTFLPPLALGLVSFGLVVVGYVRERWRQRHGRHSSFLRKWVVDPISIVRTRGPVAVFAGLALGTFALLAWGAASLALVEFTGSNEFCGEVCHAVMTPEATVYADSPHARIACVECHVGPGGDSYLRAKLNGLSQVWAVATGNIQRPIPTPIRHARSSSDMCESCHQSDRLIGYKALSRTYFLTGEENERVRLQMMLKVGGGRNGLIKGWGIHFHMLSAHKVEYIARDPQRQDIAWVRVTDPKGSVKEYSNADEPLTDAERASLPVRRIECLDCHSRPAHRFRSPVDSVNAALAAGILPADIPYVVEASVRALDGGYATTEQAMAELGANLREFYEEEHPEVLDDDPGRLETTLAALKDIYRRTIFPEMKADWKAHPNNIGHRDWPGCFRCHNEDMVDAEEEPIFTDCARCHAILGQGTDAVEVKVDFDEGLAFVHPEDQETVEEFTLCSDCHTGGADLYE